MPSCWYSPLALKTTACAVRSRVGSCVLLVNLRGECEQNRNKLALRVACRSSRVPRNAGFTGLFMGFHIARFISENQSPEALVAGLHPSNTRGDFGGCA